MGKFKLNVDTTWNEDSAGIGGLIRDHQGQVQLSFTRQIVHSPLPKHAETVAIREGLRLAERFGYADFIIERIDKLKSRSSVLSFLGYIHGQIFSLVDWLMLSLSFVWRKGNVPTHSLAAKAISTYSSNVWMEGMPSCISTAI